jgi:hypothetical protein
VVNGVATTEIVVVAAVVSAEEAGADALVRVSVASLRAAPRNPDPAARSTGARTTNSIRRAPYRRRAGRARRRFRIRNTRLIISPR